MARTRRSIFGTAAALALAASLAACGGKAERAAAGSAATFAPDEPDELPGSEADDSLFGGFAASQASRSVQPSDLQKMTRSQYRSLEYMPSGRPTSWRNTSSGNHGTFVSRSAYTDGEGDICRPYTHMVTIDGQSRTLNGIACRDAQGRWREGDHG